MGIRARLKSPSYCRCYFLENVAFCLSVDLGQGSFVDRANLVDCDGDPLRTCVVL